MTDQLAQGGLGEGEGARHHWPTPTVGAATPTGAGSLPIPGASAPDPVSPVTAAPRSTTESSPEPAPSAPPVSRRRQRVSKWDRPPDPHDWRFFVGNLGKILIATGILMFGFVAYQLWGTGIETARAQSALKNEFEELIAQNQVDDAEGATADGPADPPDSDVEPTDGAVQDPASDDADEPADGGNDPSDIDDAPAGTVVSGGDVTDTAAEPLEPVEQDIPPIFRGDPLALLEIPAIGRSDIVVPGVSLNDLKDGPGHYPDTPLPGQLGNASIAGHRTTYGAPFFDVDDLVPGDELIVTMLTGDRFVYEVTGIEIVTASDYWVVTTSDPNRAELTLTSCHPKYTARDRIVVHSLLNPTKSSNVGFTTAPYELDVDDEPIPGDDPVLVADEPADDGTDDPGQVDPSGGADLPAAADPGDPAPGNDTDDATDPAAAQGDDDQTAGPATPVDAGTDTELDAFSQGWFDDRAAFPQIALWGIALTLISIGAYRISRRFRHDSIGLAAGILPFLFCLYFFFQNVNRLLPPGL